MTRQENYELWAEYAASRNLENNLSPQMMAVRLQKEREQRKQKTTDAGRFYVPCPENEWWQKMKAIAITNCKSRAEWQAEYDAGTELDTSRGIMTHKCAQELLEKYQNRAVAAYQTCQSYIAQIQKCEDKIAELTIQQQEPNKNISIRAQISIQNKLTHWIERRICLSNKLAEFENKERHFSKKMMMWLGITEKIKQAEIAREISKERCGKGNKYGFNLNMQSRETATGIFSDFDD